MKKLTLLLSLTLFASAASAADDIRIISVQIMKSAKQPLSFIDRSPAIYAVLYVTDTTGAQYTLGNDSLTAIEAAMSLKETLEEYDALAEYDIPVYNFYSFCTDSTTCPYSVKAITDHDLAIIVKHLSILPYRKAEKKYTDNYGEYFHVGVYVPYTATLEVYDAATNEYSHKETLSDTLFWDKNTMDIEPALAELPDDNEAKLIAAAEIGRLYAQRLAPYWRTVQRFFFVPSGTELQHAADYAENAEWAQAMAIWEKYAGNNNRKTAAQAAFNMALGCEVKGNYELALEWLQYAEKIYSIFEITGYKAILQRRINESNLLEKQLQDL